ncbi:hypothetical protein Agub_g9041, partial [Astrephomene gubernaculifera]
TPEGAPPPPASIRTAGEGASPDADARTRRQLKWLAGSSGGAATEGGDLPYSSTEEAARSTRTRLGEQEDQAQVRLDVDAADEEDADADGLHRQAAAAGAGGGAGSSEAAPQAGEDGGDGGFDLVRLCATFSVDPSVMAFAQHIKAMRDLWVVEEAAAAAAEEDRRLTGRTTSGGGGSRHDVSGMRRGLVLLASEPREQEEDVEPKDSRSRGNIGGGGGGEKEEDAGRRRRLLVSRWQRRQRQRRRGHGADLLSFCYSALYECITGEKTAALPLYLHLHCLVHRAAGDAALDSLTARIRSTPSSSGGALNSGLVDGSGLDASQLVLGPMGRSHPCSLLTGPSVPLTAALQGLQLARSYYSGPLAAAAATAAAATGDVVFTDLDEQALWRPLLQPAFLESLWCALQHRRWRPLGLLPQPGGAPPASRGMSAGVGVGAAGGGGVRPAAAAAVAAAPVGSALGVYLRKGHMPGAADFDAVVTGISRLVPEPELQSELARCLALHHLPPLAAVSTALEQLRALPVWPQVRELVAAAAAAAGGAGGAAAGCGVPPSLALLPLLSLVLPGVPHEALLLLAAAAPV